LKPISRRELLKTTLLAPPAVAATQRIAAVDVAQNRMPETSGPLTSANSLASAAPGVGRERLLLDFGWRFHFGHANDPAEDFGYGSGSAGNFRKTGNFMPAAAIAFHDGEWRRVDLPHDWAVELSFVNDPDLQAKGFRPLGRKYPETSVGWYRRVFELSAEDVDRRITIEFDGVYREATVVFNGFYIGKHTGGYDPFSFDVSDFIYPGHRNVLLIRVDATESDGWFYEGAGIYRHVWLLKTNRLHVKQWGTFVRSEVGRGEAGLSILTEVRNCNAVDRNARVISTILDPSGKPVVMDMSPEASIAADADHDYRQQVEVSRPQLWSLDERNIYKLITEIQSGGATVDRYETLFGIRAVELNATKGLLLNGHPVKIKGTCNHQDHAGLGTALPDAVQYFRVRKLQEMGSNALRTAHNPATPGLLDACDQLGMLVLAETRMMSSNHEGLSQLANLVRRDRNHPSVFMWSMGNEEAQSKTSRGVQILTRMKAVAHRHDGSRPVTCASVFDIGRGGLAVSDVTGYNYTDPEAAEFHMAHPGKPMMGTEAVSAVGTRGIYITDPAKGYVSSYDRYSTSGFGSAEGWWSFCIARPWLAGSFVWTGFDYRGEPAPNGWPNSSSQFGIVDTCGFPKDSFYYYQSWWTDKPVLHLFPHWNWPGMEGKTIAVWVYSNLDKVELFLDGKSLGSKEVKKDSHLAWIVRYAPGIIEARGWQGGRQTLTTRHETTGIAAKLILRSDRATLHADGEDVAMCSVEVQDAQGRTVPVTNNEVTFLVSGSGKLIGVGNGDPTDHDSDKGGSRKAFGGYCMAMVQATQSAGDVTLEVHSPGLASASIIIPAKEVSLRPQVAAWKRAVPKGVGITGLWRPVAQPHGPKSDLVEMLGGACSVLNSIFTFREEGGRLTGTVEGGGGFGFSARDDVPVPIVDGVVDSSRITFKAGDDSFEGKVNGDQIELQRFVESPFQLPAPSSVDSDRPAIGPAADGSEPSLNETIPSSIIMTLRRAEA
jgi:beta-galactosidase